MYTDEQLDEISDIIVAEVTEKAKDSLECIEIFMKPIIDYYIMQGDDEQLHSARTIKLALSHLKIGD